MAARPIPLLSPDPVIEALKRDVDRTLLRERLRLTPYERLQALQAALRDLESLQHTFGTRSPRK